MAMAAFRLSRPGEKLDDLQRESRMPGERCIRFDVCSAEGAEALCDNHCAQGIGLPRLSSVHRAFEGVHVRWGTTTHTSYGRVARWRSRSTPRIQSFGKPIAAAQNSSLTMPCMRFEWLGSWPLGKNSFVDMSRLAASVRDLCDMVGNGIEHVLVRGVGKQSLLNGLVSNGRDP